MRRIRDFALRTVGIRGTVPDVPGKVLPHFSAFSNEKESIL